MQTLMPYVSAYTLLQLVEPSTIHWDSQKKKIPSVAITTRSVTVSGVY